MSGGRQRVIFVGRSLWGGGAEKAAFDLVHALDRQLFDRHVVHLFEEGTPPIAYEDGIMIHSNEAAAQALAAEGCVVVAPPASGEKDRWVRNLCVAAALRVSQGIIGKTCRRIASRLRPASRNSESPQQTVASLQHRIDQVVQPVCAVLPQVFALQRILRAFGRESLLVPIMEEAAVRVWLTQVAEKHPYVVSLHSVESYNLALMYPDPGRYAVEAWLFENACRSAEAVVVPTEGCRQDLCDNFAIPLEQVRVIGNPVDCAAIVERARAPLPSALPDKKTIFVQVARLDADKNPGLVIEAARLLKGRYDDFAVLLLGKGALKDALQKTIDDLGLRQHVHLLGQVDNPYPFMAASRALLLTSHVESFSLVLVEAMLCGTVPVSVDCPAGPREVLEKGRYGVLVPPGDPVAFAEAMYRIAHDDALHEELKARGPERARSFDVSAVVPQWERLFRDIHQRGSACRRKEDA
jgi:glycosyltransferase involved in cell wall biosynthesis